MVLTLPPLVGPTPIPGASTLHPLSVCFSGPLTPNRGYPTTSLFLLFNSHCVMFSYFVVFCCLTNHPRTQWLKTTVFIISQGSVGQESGQSGWNWLISVPCDISWDWDKSDSFFTFLHLGWEGWQAELSQDTVSLCVISRGHSTWALLIASIARGPDFMHRGSGLPNHKSRSS